MSQNCSYLKNPGYPSAYTSTSSCQFTIDKCDSSVCDLRLDFEKFTTNGPAATDETDGGLCQDMLTVTVNTGQAIPEICGENSGQHSKATNLIKKIFQKIIIIFSLFGLGKGILR